MLSSPLSSSDKAPFVTGKITQSRPPASPPPSLIIAFGTRPGMWGSSTCLFNDTILHAVRKFYGSLEGHTHVNSSL
ncbi:hypothetical protein WG66_005439 [Moniliophthora roreri]|nr:hypothetical protein WG66_005439 [Moniliophthora roreri]